jgi:arylsulfatase A-like enzyme
MAIQADRTVGRLFEYLDRRIGLQNVVVVLTADHGVAEMPEAHGQMPGGRIKDADLQTAAQAAIEGRYGGGKWVAKVFDGAVYLNRALVQEKNLSEADVENTAAAALERMPHIFRIYTRDQLRRGLVAQDAISRTVSGSLNWARSADLQVILDPHWIRPADNTGHDTPFAYDTHIPLVLMGPGIRAGLYFQNVILNDLAPTLASLLSVQTPSGSSGRVLHEIFGAPVTSTPAPRASSRR